MIKLQIPVKYMWRDSQKILIDSLTTFTRNLAQPFGVNWTPIPYSQITGDIGHPGLDIAMPVGERVMSAHDGIVSERDDVDDNDGLGISVYNKTERIVTIYWHLSFNYVNIGDKIRTGQLLGLSGGTGKSYGPHLHFGLYNTDENGKVINTNNGYHGAIDPLPYMSLSVFNAIAMTRDFVSNFYLFYFGRLPELDELNFWDGKNYRDLFTAALQGRIDNYKTNQQ